MNIRTVLSRNIKLFKDVNRIGRINVFSYLYHKIKYMIIR
jgi:hypothetical protein